MTDREKLFLEIIQQLFNYAIDNEPDTERRPDTKVSGDNVNKPRVIWKYSPTSANSGQESMHTPQGYLPSLDGSPKTDGHNSTKGS